MTPAEPSAASVERVLPASPDEVFREWVDPEGMRDWMCPRPAHATKVTLDPVVGGLLRIDISDQGLDFFVSGTYLELDRPHRLRFTWRSSAWEDPTAESIVTVTLQPHDESSTLMTIRHVLLPGPVRDDYRRGWTAIAAQLESHLLA